MSLATQNRRSLISLTLLSALGVLVTTQGDATNAPMTPVTPIASCAMPEAERLALTGEGNTPAQPAHDAVVRRIDWRAMLPAVTRSRA
jgi:hypothetical protein